MENGKRRKKKKLLSKRDAPSTLPVTRYIGREETSFYPFCNDRNAGFRFKVRNTRNPTLCSLSEMKNCSRINDGSIGCRESYLKNAIINSGQRRNWTREKGRGESVYLWNTWPRILGGSERILSGLSQLTNSSGDFVVLLFLSKGIQDGSIDAKEGWVWSVYDREAIEGK